MTTATPDSTTAAGGSKPVFLSIEEAAAEMDAGRLSAVDLTEAILERIDETDDQLNSYVLVMKESALAEAEASAERARAGKRLGPLDGIPMGIKDIYDTAGYVTTNGTAAHRFRVPAADSTAVARLRAAGSVVVGKTNTHELAMGGTTNIPSRRGTNRHACVKVVSS